MNFNRRKFLGIAGVGALGAAAPGLLRESEPANAAPPSPVDQPAPAVAKPVDRPPLLDRAMTALEKHDARIAQRDLVGLVDFSAHSSERRFQLVNVTSGEIVADYLVAHGRGSDPRHTGYVETFSNVPGSNASSRGSYLVANSYYGKYGRARRLIGLDPDNDLALDRAIVIHGASYVASDLAEAQGRIGRSFGCFSVSEGDIADVLERLGEGCLLYADRT